jgi:murein DD-endopeptidase MepM/ murein hydrolase activator NlpD
MPPPRAPGQARRTPKARAVARRRQQRRIAGLVAAFVAGLITLLLTAFGSGSPTPAVTSTPAPAKRLLPAGPPRPQVVALRGTLRLQLPIDQSRVTAIGYHAAGGGALALDPIGRQANEGVFSRVVRRLFGGAEGGLRYYKLGGESGADTSALDVGAPPGTDVYSPVDGTIVGITPYVVNEDKRRYGKRIDIQPAAAPSYVVTLTHLRPDPALTVGSSVAASRSKIGTVLDFSRVERQALARYTQDSGNHVSVEVHPAATLALP